MSDSAVFSESVRTALGNFRLAATNRGLVAIGFPNQHFPQVQLSKQKQPPPRVKRILKQAKLFLRDFFCGKTTDGTRIQIDWRFFSDFDRKICRTLQKVSKNQFLTYSELAQRAQVPKAARAVASAMGRNPIPILIPCHRVIRKDQTLGGYSAGLRWKRLLLDLEKGKV